MHHLHFASLRIISSDMFLAADMTTCGIFDCTFVPAAGMQKNIQHPSFVDPTLTCSALTRLSYSPGTSPSAISSQQVFSYQPLLWLLTAMRSPLVASLLALTLSIASSAAISSTEQMPLNVSFSQLDNSESQDVRINKKRRKLFHPQKLSDLLIHALHLFSFERTVPTHHRYSS